MDSFAYEMEIKKLSLKIEENLQQIIKIKEKIKDLKEASEKISKSRIKFDEFMEYQKKINATNSKRNCKIKAFESLIRKENQLLTGREYYRARENYEKVNRGIKKKIEKLCNDIDVYQEEISNMVKERDVLSEKYMKEGK